MEQDTSFKADITSQLPFKQQEAYRSGFSTGNQGRQLNVLGNEYLGYNSTSASFSGYQVPDFLNAEGPGGCGTALVGDNGTGIKIRSRQVQNPSGASSFVVQGSAPRRIRLQKKLQVGPVSCSMARGSVHSNTDNKGPSTELEVRFLALCS